MFILKETELIKISEGNIEVDVALTSEETINIYFILPKNDNHHTTELAIISYDPNELISKATEIHKKYSEKIIITLSVAQVFSKAFFATVERAYPMVKIRA